MRKQAIIAGSGSTLWQDVARAKRFLVDPVIICVNHTALYWPNLIDACVSIHAELFEGVFLSLVRLKDGRTCDGLGCHLASLSGRVRP